HFLDYETAQALDRETTELIEQLDVEHLSNERACGRSPLRGLLLSLRNRGRTIRCIDLRNSGDTAGAKREVVGYGSYVVC
ncbi:MAG: AmmeMemoRadiSam system protein B, partial [Deltaproteobacteria bacterium]